MSGVNKVILIGNLGSDPELRDANGTPVCNFSIATSETWTDKATNEKKEQTEWHRLVLWRRNAEIASQYLKKGSKIYIEGKLQTRSYDKEGVKTYTTEVVVDRLQMLDSKGDSGGGSAQAPVADAPPVKFDGGDDLPF